MKVHAAPLALTVLLATGCTDDTADPAPSEDAGMDAAVDSGRDGGRDGGPDAARDATLVDSTYVDAAPDAQRDSAASASACAGDRWLANEEDLAALRPCTSIGGKLSMTSGLKTAELPNLEEIDHFLTVWENGDLKSVSFPKLRRIGAFLDISSNHVLQSISMPALQSVNERRIETIRDVAIMENPALLPCQAESIRDQLKAAGFQGTIDVSNNGAACQR